MPSKGPSVNAKTSQAASQPSASHRPAAKTASPATSIPNSGVPLPPEEMPGPQSAAQKDSSSVNPGAPKKRKPRKLNRGPSASAKPSAAKPEPEHEHSSSLNAEIETLKNRIRDLELQVEELYQKATSGVPSRQPRRRGRGRGVPPPPGSPEELVRLESELEATQQELADLRTHAAGPSEKRRPSERPTRSNSGRSVDEDVEEIPRTSAPAADSKTKQRQVTVAGSYRIPLPSSVSMDDVRTIQSGINSASTVAKSLLDAHRAQKAAQQAKASTANDGSKGDGKPQSWGEWVGGYSMSIARMVNSIEAEAAVESTPATGSSRPSTSRPRVQQRVLSAPASGTPTSKDATGSGSSSAGRPKLKSANRDGGAGRKLSQQQLESLMA